MGRYRIDKDSSGQPVVVDTRAEGMFYALLFWLGLTVILMPITATVVIWKRGWDDAPWWAKTLYPFLGFCLFFPIIVVTGGILIGRFGWKSMPLLWKVVFSLSSAILAITLVWGTISSVIQQNRTNQAASAASQIRLGFLDEYFVDSGYDGLGQRAFGYVVAVQVINPDSQDHEICLWADAFVRTRNYGTINWFGTTSNSSDECSYILHAGANDRIEIPVGGFWAGDPGPSSIVWDTEDENGNYDLNAGESVQTCITLDEVDKVRVGLLWKRDPNLDCENPGGQ